MPRPRWHRAGRQTAPADAPALAAADAEHLVRRAPYSAASSVGVTPMVSRRSPNIGTRSTWRGEPHGFESTAHHRQPMAGCAQPRDRFVGNDRSVGDVEDRQQRHRDGRRRAGTPRRGPLWAGHAVHRDSIRAWLDRPVVLRRRACDGQGRELRHRAVRKTHPPAWSGARALGEMVRRADLAVPLRSASLGRSRASLLLPVIEREDVLRPIRRRAPVLTEVTEWRYPRCGPVNAPCSPP